MIDKNFDTACPCACAGAYEKDPCEWKVYLDHGAFSC